MCEQTCQVSRNFRESPEMAGDLQLSRKCKQMSRNRGNFIDPYLQLSKKMSATAPPPPNRVRWRRSRKFSATTPRVRLRRSRTISATAPPPPNLVGFWRSQNIYRVESAECPPPPNKYPGYAVVCVRVCGFVCVQVCMRVFYDFMNV